MLAATREQFSVALISRVDRMDPTRFQNVTNAVPRSSAEDRPKSY